MFKRILSLLMLLAMLAPALAEEAEWPVVINRVDDPQVCADFAFAEEAELLQITFPQMVDCDAILLRCGGETMLVDACKKAYSERIVDLCKQLGVTRIDRVVNTHPHEDHLGGFSQVIKEIEVGELWICFPEDYNNHMKTAVNAAKKAGIPIKTYTDGDVLTLGGATIEVWKLEGKIGEMNDCSAQMKVTFGERTMLLAADLQQDGQKKMVELHGEALDAVRPMLLVITNNHRQTAGWKWIHSDKNTIPYAYTVPNLVHLTTDGTTWIAEKIPSAVKY